jgi:succinate dehydrogenase/fumarate reductase flavoprotein subunit
MQPSELHTYDVIVLGMGAAGLSAAITAHDAGASVAIVEKMPPEKAGGNSRVSGQVWFNPNDADRAAVYLRALSGEYELPEPLVRAWARESVHNTEWIEARAREVWGQVPRDDGDPYTGDPAAVIRLSHGAELRAIGWRDVPDEEFPELEGIDCGTDYNYFGGSQGWSRLWLTLRTAQEHRSIPVFYDVRAKALVRDAAGEVMGVSAVGADGQTRSFSADKAVVLATGGFANSQDLAKNFLRLTFVTPWGSPANTGDGIKLAQKIGADLAHPYNYMSMPGLRMPPYETGEFGQPQDHRYILVGKDGKRFVDELQETRHGKILMRGEFEVYPGFPMWTIFDERGRLAGPLVPPRENFAGGWMKQIERYVWSTDNQAEIDRGWIMKADSLEELAEKLDIDADGLVAQVALINEAADTGHDHMYGRAAETLRRIDTPPYYGYRWAQLLISTLGGIRKDEYARVLDPYGAPIPRLYTAGDTASTYSWCLSGGLGLGDALVFGRIAARHAAALPARTASATVA